MEHCFVQAQLGSSPFGATKQDALAKLMEIHSLKLQLPQEAPTMSRLKDGVSTR